MIPFRYRRTCIALLCTLVLGCSSGEAVEKNTTAVSKGLIIESKWTEAEGILASETHKPLDLSYVLSNLSDEDKVLRLTRISCGCATLSVSSGTVTKSLSRGDIFTIAAHEKVTVTLLLSLVRKPMGPHTFPIELSVLNAGTEESFPLPELRVRILADISAEPPVLSHQFRWNDAPIVEQRLTITTRQKVEDSEQLPVPKIGSLPNYITLKELRKLESIKSDKYQTEKWMAIFTLKRPNAEDYTIATAIKVSFPGSLHRTITIPSVVTANRGVEARPRSVTFTSAGSAQGNKRIVLLTATDSRPFSIIRITTRSGLCRAKLRESKISVSHLIEVTPSSTAKPSWEDTLEVETAHPDTPAIAVRLSRAG